MTHPIALTILVADADPVRQDILGAGLRDLGHAIVCVADARAAAAHLTNCRTHVIFMDVRLPDLAASLAVLTGLGERRPWIVGLAAELDDRDACLDVGMDDIITAPTPAAIARALTRATTAIRRATEVVRASAAANADAVTAAEAASTGAPPDDLAAVRRLLAHLSDGEPQAYDASRQDLVDSLERSFQQLCDAFTAGDRRQAYLQADNFRSIALSAGLGCLGGLAARLEQTLAGDSPLADLRDSMDRLSSDVACTCDRLRVA